MDGPDRAQSAVIFVIEGMGANCVYPEYGAEVPEDSSLNQVDLARIFNLTGRGARVLDLKVPVPRSNISQSVLFTGRAWADPSLLSVPGSNLFDAARAEGFLCAAIIEGEETIPLILEQDAVLFFEDGPVVGAKESAPADLILALQKWRDLWPTVALNVPERYWLESFWTLDATADLVEVLSDSDSNSGSRPRPFILTIVLDSVGSAGESLGPEGYIRSIEVLDAPLGRLVQVCENEGVLLFVTSDRGMDFTSSESKGDHDSSRSSDIECLRVPAVFFGPGVDEIIVAGSWSQVDLAPTIQDLLGLEVADTEGAVIPISDRYDLRIEGATPSKTVVVGSGDRAVAKASGDTSYLFRGLKRGVYSVESGHQVRSICLNGDGSLDLGRDILLPKISWPKVPHVQSRTLAGAFLIAVINLVGAIAIIRIARAR